MALSKADLIIHPVRFRLMRALVGAALTTQEIADQMPDVPKSSIYRHLRLLLEAEFVYVSETKAVRGVQEKRYRLSQMPYLGPDDVAGLSADEHLHYFTTYLLTTLQDFSGYLSAAEAKGTIDMPADRVGYTEVSFYASTDELDRLQQGLNSSFMELIQNGPGDGRERRKFAVIAHPVKE